MKVKKTVIHGSTEHSTVTMTSAPEWSPSSTFFLVREESDVTILTTVKQTHLPENLLTVYRFAGSEVTGVSRHGDHDGNKIENLFSSTDIK